MNLYIGINKEYKKCNGMNMNEIYIMHTYNFNGIYMIINWDNSKKIIDRHLTIIHIKQVKKWKLYSIVTLVNKKILWKLFLFLIIFNINFIEIDKIGQSFVNRYYYTVILCKFMYKMIDRPSIIFYSIKFLFMRFLIYNVCKILI